MRRCGFNLIVLLTLTVACLCSCNKHDRSTSTAQTPTSPTAPGNPEPPQPAPPGPEPCSYTLTADPDDFGPDGGNTTLRIVTAAGCTWTARSDASWLIVEGTSTGAGPGAVKLFAQRNDTPSTRRANVSAGDVSLAIAQDGLIQTVCSYQVQPVNITIPRSAWTGDVSITTSPGCAWTATSTAPWLRVRSGAGTGPGTLTYDADFNPQTAYADRRSGVIEIRWTAPTAGQNVHVVQWGECNTTATPATGGLAAGATYSGSSAAGTLNVGAQGGAFHFWVLTDPFMGCAWTAESTDTWVTWTFPRLHQVMSGDGDLHFTVPAKAGSDTRNAVVTLGARFRLTIVQ